MQNKVPSTYILWSIKRLWLRMVVLATSYCFLLEAVVVSHLHMITWYKIVSTRQIIEQTNPSFYRVDFWHSKAWREKKKLIRLVQELCAMSPVKQVSNVYLCTFLLCFHGQVSAGGYGWVALQEWPLWEDTGAALFWIQPVPVGPSSPIGWVQHLRWWHFLDDIKFLSSWVFLFNIKQNMHGSEKITVWDKIL